QPRTLNAQRSTFNLRAVAFQYGGLQKIAGYTAVASAVSAENVRAARRNGMRWGQRTLQCTVSRSIGGPAYPEIQIENCWRTSKGTRTGRPVCGLMGHQSVLAFDNN